MTFVTGPRSRLARIGSSTNVLHKVLCYIEHSTVTLGVTRSRSIDNFFRNLGLVEKEGSLKILNSYKPFIIQKFVNSSS